LLSLLKGASHGVLYNEHMEGDGAIIFRHACTLGCEGIVSKRANSFYRSGRSRDWIKTKSPAALRRSGSGRRTGTGARTRACA
jgi:ATP-dependent DNA ligase